MKKIYCIRHGKALHNVLHSLIGKIAYTSDKYIDTPLVEEGIYQSKNLGFTWKEKNSIEVVFVSPCIRTIDTAINIFKGTGKKIIAVEEIIEYSQGKEYINLRKNKSILEEKYPNVDFSLIEETPKYWNNKRIETFDELKKRDLHFKYFLNNRNEKKICIVSHSTYLKQFLFGMVDSLNESNELKHCFPYEKPLENEIVKSTY